MDGIQKIYLESDQDLRVKRSIVGCILSIILMPAGVSLDWFLYPNFLEEFIAVRFLCSAITTLLLGLHYTSFGKRNIKVLTFSWLLLIPTFICWMIFITDGYFSTYYAGLNLVILATAVVLPFTMVEMVSFCAITVILYVISAIKFPLVQGGLLYNNVYFLVLTSIISITSSYLNSKYRFKEFCLNYELKETVKTLKTTQDQLVQSEKINAIGSLSAGLLHEVNNPLNYTITALHVMKMDPHVSSDEDLKDTMKDIEEGMMRIKNIVTDLRAFAYPEEADKRNNFAVAGAVESAVRFTASDTQDIEKIINVDESLMVMASKTHIVQVLINLLSNAAKAINKTGRKDGVIRVDAKQENDRIIVTVADNGTGMSEDIVRKVFDPFFTTNDVGKGMGLGLSVSHTIVKNHGGNLTVTSKVGEGSIFRFDLGV